MIKAVAIGLISLFVLLVFELLLLFTERKEKTCPGCGTSKLTTEGGCGACGWSGKGSRKAFRRVRKLNKEHYV